MKKKIELFDIINFIFIALVTLICFYPIWYVFVISISTLDGYYLDPYHIIPTSFTMSNYMSIIKDRAIPQAFFVSVKVTVIGTFLSIVLTTIAGYTLSKEKLPGIKVIYKCILFTMYFSGGMVPMYLLVSNLCLKNTMWSLILPGCIGTFYVVLARNYFLSLPESLEESAEIDGANGFQILYKIVAPISKPILASLTLFYIVGYWNNYMNAVLYITTPKQMPLQAVIRMLVSATKMGGEDFATVNSYHKDGANMASVFVAILPILLIYPLLQKYFVKGVMIGAVKG